MNTAFVFPGQGSYCAEFLEELRDARDKLTAARAAIGERENVKAQWLAREALVNAELAVAKTVAAQARDASRAKAQENDRLRRELGEEDGPG